MNDTWWTPPIALVFFLFVSFLGMVLCSRNANASPLDGTWLVADRVAVDMSDCGGAVCGRIVWLRNPDLRTPQMCGRSIVWGLSPDGPQHWANGWVFDPETGRTYHLSAVRTSNDLIQARMYAGLSIFGETKMLKRITSRSLAGWC